MNRVIAITEWIDGVLFTFAVDEFGQCVLVRRNGIDVTEDGKWEQFAMRRLGEMGINLQEKLSILFEETLLQKGAS